MCCANYDCKQFSKEILTGIGKACQEIMDGKLHEQFAVDMIQGGAKTSANMAANEVIANRALELMGFQKGESTNIAIRIITLTAPGRRTTLTPRRCTLRCSC